MTDTPTPTPTATPTPAPTPNYYVELTTPYGQGARIVREVTVSEFTIILLLLALLISIWVMYLSRRLKGGRGE